MSEILVKLSSKESVLCELKNGKVDATKPIVSYFTDKGFQGAFTDETFIVSIKDKVQVIKRYFHDIGECQYTRKIKNKIDERLSCEVHRYGNTNLSFPYYSWTNFNNKQYKENNVVVDTRFINKMKAILKFRNGYIEEIITHPNAAYKRLFKFKKINNQIELMSITTTPQISNAPAITFNYSFHDGYFLHDKKNKVLISEFKTYTEFPVDILQMHIFMVLNNNNFDANLINFSDDEKTLLTHILI